MKVGVKVRICWGMRLGDRLKGGCKGWEQVGGVVVFCGFKDVWLLIGGR